MKRLAEIVAAILLVLLGVGYGSNALSKRDVEEAVSSENREALDEVTRLWHLHSKPPSKVEDSAVLIRISPTSEGKLVKMTLPPRSALPFAYAIAKPIAPFVFRVYYGWAAGTDRMAFGEGGEKIVLAVFGKTKSLRTRPHWNF